MKVDKTQKALNRLQSAVSKNTRQTASLVRKTDLLDSKLKVMDKKVDSVDTKVQVMGRRFTVTEKKVDVLDGRINSLEMTVDVRFDAVDESLKGIETTLATHSINLVEHDEKLDYLIKDSKEKTTRFERIDNSLVQVIDMLKGLKEENTSTHNRLLRLEQKVGI